MTGLILILKLLQKKLDHIEWFGKLLKTKRPDHEEETIILTETNEESKKDTQNQENEEIIYLRSSYSCDGEINNETKVMTEGPTELKAIIKHSNVNNCHGENNTEVNREMLSENNAATAKQNENSGQTHSSNIMVLVSRLGLSEYYPDKLQLTDVMKIKRKSTPILSELAFTFVQNLIMGNFTCRDKMLQEYIKLIKQASNEGSENLQNEADKKELSGALDDLLSEEDDTDKSEDTIINPLDLTLALFLCSSPFLKTFIATKLYECQLAIPFVYPALESECLSVSYWPLRGIIMESKVDTRPVQNMSVDCPSQIVACIRLGRPSVSKSKLINEVINDQYHNTFFNKDCSLGTSNRCISDGLIEAAWYIPSGNAKLLNSLTMFLNLRGDGLHYNEQHQFLSKLATVVIVFLNISVLENQEIQNTLCSLYGCEGGVLLAIDANSYNKTAVKKKLDNFYLKLSDRRKKQTQLSILAMNGAMRSISVIKDELRGAVRKLSMNANPLSLSKRLAKLHAKLDENEDIYILVKNTVKTIIDLIPDKSSNAKEQVLPLQGKLWRSYSNNLKLVNKSSQYKSIREAGNLRKEMNADRTKQAEICNTLGPFMNKYLDSLLTSFKSDNEFVLLVMWTKMVLDERSRSILPDFMSNYQSDWQALKSARDKKEKDAIQQLQTKLDESEYNLAEASFGFEHLCREMGQMFEAVSVCELAPSHLQEKTKSLPDIAVKLLMIGQPFEIMDGDAANVPVLWVKAVLSRLKNVLGDKKLLALSVFGIQSSGKSTLLNTMFGLQFAVSAGRCTRGVFMQLVQVAETTLPFDYVLVIETEGLRAPELAHQKYSHDNELATFVIGLGDITIVNIKGENTAELKDVLQISVHAFLRLKLANKRLNLMQSCIFIHQNVPATDANDKMMQGRKKFFEILDEMTKEAAAQENIADIQSFNQVIEFNSEKNVWYFSDLWRGDPPMAPINPGYSENVASVKEALLFQLTAKRTTYLTIDDTINRIEDLWNGILKDDFVFSFRNSLELKAYNSMEQHCQALTWRLEKYVLEFVRTECRRSLVDCTDVNELENAVLTIFMRLSSEMSKNLECVIEDLDKFVYKNTHKDIMIQWVQHKRNRFKILVESLVENSKIDINNTKEEIRIAQLQLSEKTNHEMEINNLARNLAITMMGEKPGEDILKDKFNGLWSSWINKFSTQDTRGSVPVITQIESMLYEKFPSDATFIETIKNLPDEEYYQTVNLLENSVHIDWISVKEHLSCLAGCGWERKKANECKQKTLHALNMIFQAIDKMLSVLKSQDTKFDISYATEILHMVTGGIADFNKHSFNNYTFNILPPFRAMIILHVIRYVKVFFTRLNDIYKRKHSPKAQMEEYKGTVWDLFKTVVEFKTEDVIAVRFFRESITKVVIQHVEQLLPIDVQEYIVALFVNGKYSLIKDILIYLAKIDSFEQIESYLMNPFKFAEKWISNRTNETLFVDKVFAALARARIVQVFTQLSQCVSEVMERCREDLNFNVSDWIQCFLDSNRDIKGLPLSADTLKHVLNSKLSDLSSFSEMIVESLKDMETHIIDMFKNTDLNSVKWKENPLSKIMIRLWGCTEVCMFCNEPCMNTDIDHVAIKQPHKCLQHRPIGIGGLRWTVTEKLSIDFCNHLVTTDKTFRRKGQTGPYKDYKLYFPEWDIPPNSDVSKFWMWLMNKYQSDIAKMYSAELPDIPEYWASITNKQALDSL